MKGVWWGSGKHDGLMGMVAWGMEVRCTRHDERYICEVPFELVYLIAQYYVLPFLLFFPFIFFQLFLFSSFPLLLLVHVNGLEFG
ncbi:hypothetical protein VNO80_10081 [Phaseolus coccineus]|uniref:Transmembrane protein n=1 Tax=Phaseolus coccineus TaxID=3886 RepID=A0AAN9REC4_PHACN